MQITWLSVDTFEWWFRENTFVNYNVDTSIYIQLHTYNYIVPGFIITWNSWQVSHCWCKTSFCWDRSNVFHIVYQLTHLGKVDDGHTYHFDPFILSFGVCSGFSFEFLCVPQSGMYHKNLFCQDHDNIFHIVDFWHKSKSTSHLRCM